MKPTNGGMAMSAKTHCPRGHEDTAGNTIILRAARKDGSIGGEEEGDVLSSVAAEGDETSPSSAPIKGVAPENQNIRVCFV
jgi:hypothetical protein